MNTIEKPLFRLAHISDLHFSKLTWNPLQFCSKRWLGNLNLLFKRKQAFKPDDLTTLFPIFHERKIDAVLITGDLTSTSHEEEFILAQQFVKSLKQEKFKVFALPGNHDQYTKKAYKKQLFYQFFNATYASPTDPLISLSLKEDEMTVVYFGHGWWLIALDTAIATSLISSNGYFSPRLEQNLEKALKEIPADHRVILINHFPIFSNESSRKSLIRKDALKKLIERFPKIKLFLHGHTHRHCIADLRSSHLPIFLDSGSTAQKEGGTWNLINIATSGCEVEVFKNTHGDGDAFWQPVFKSNFKW
jgi:3',5'-cyclic AMP phosphodiesterase CpdA